LKSDLSNACAVKAYVESKYKCVREPLPGETAPPTPPVTVDPWTPDPDSNTPPPDEEYDETKRKPIWWYHSDHLGSSTYLTDNFGRPTHYYDNMPFGETMVEHNQSTFGKEQYDNAYKFNGKELDESTQMYYYGARYYDPRISIFVSNDPLAERTMTPYQYVHNNPIMFTDPTGMEADGIIIRGANGQEHTYGEETKYTGNDKFIKQTLSDIDEIKKSSEGNYMIERLDTSNNDFIIQESTSKNDFQPDSMLKATLNNKEVNSKGTGSSDGSGGIISYNPNLTTSGKNTEGKLDRPAFVGLAHELFHGRESDKGQLFRNSDSATYSSKHRDLSKNEWRAVYYENILRGQLNIPLRTHYGLMKEEGSGYTKGSGPRLIDKNNQPINYIIP